MKRKVIPHKRFTSQMGLSLFILFVMVLSVIGFGLLNAGQTPGAETFNGLQMIQNSDGSWRIIHNEQDYDFFYHPTNVQHLMIPNFKFNPEYAVITSDIYDDEDNMQLVSLTKFLTKQQLERQGITVINAFTRSAENVTDAPVMTCLNASKSVPVLYFNIANETEITEENNCYSLTAENGQSIIEVRDAFMYSYLLSLEEQ